MSHDSPLPGRSVARPMAAFPLASWLFLTLGAEHAAAASADLLSGGAGVLAAGVDAAVAVAVVVGLAVYRWGPALFVERIAPSGLVAGVALAALASGVRGTAAGSPWLGADVVLALLATVAAPSMRAFVVAMVGTAAVWVASLAGGGRVVRAEERSAGGWVLLALLTGVAAASAVGIRWSHGWLRAELEAVARAADRQAVTDALTGANNRRGLERLALRMIEHARRQGEAVHCLFLDVDDLRSVNEQAGRAAGDDVLRTVNEALLASIRATDVVARWSGDQFVVLGPGTGSSPLEMERRVRGHLGATSPVPADVWSGSVSIGSATLVPWDDGNLDSLLARAEDDMHLRRSLRRQGRAGRRSGESRTGLGYPAPGNERRSNPPTVPPVATDQP